MKYYTDNFGDIWKVNTEDGTYFICEVCRDKSEYMKSPVKFFTAYEEIHDLKEISEQEATDVLEGIRFINGI